jgi:hypothetical protein
MKMLRYVRGKLEQRRLHVSVAWLWRGVYSELDLVSSSPPPLLPSQNGRKRGICV